MYKFLAWIIPILFLLFGVIPFIMNLVDGKGFGYNCGLVWHGVCFVFTLGTKKRN